MLLFVHGRMGCLPAPVIAPIGNLTVPAGKSLIVSWITGTVTNRASTLTFGTRHLAAPMRCRSSCTPTTRPGKAQCVAQSVLTQRAYRAFQRTCCGSLRLRDECGRHDVYAVLESMRREHRVDFQGVIRCDDFITPTPSFTGTSMVDSFRAAIYFHPTGWAGRKGF